MRWGKVVITVVAAVAISANSVVLSAAPRLHDSLVLGGCRTSFAPPVFDPADGRLHFDIDGSCFVTPFGPASVHIDQRAAINEDGSLGSAEADITYTFSNGDTLLAFSTSESGPPNAQGVFEFTATQWFIGGTGRFAHATGTTLSTIGVVDTVHLLGAFAFSADLQF